MNEPAECQLIVRERYLNQRRNAGELAQELNVSAQYITAMKREGFRMPGGKSSIALANKFLAECPEFGVRECITRKPGQGASHK